jgi:acetoin utilization deacetylase AcuC-like enzyme
VNRTGLAIDPDGRLHDPGAGHPESPERLQVLMRLVGSQRIRALEPVVLAGRPVTDAELLRVHTPAHLQRLRSTAGMTVRLDVHHGNGTQAAFWRDPSVLYISTHQTPLFPGTGAATDMGEGLGQGRTVNIPLRAGHGDAEYDAIYGALIPRMLERFRPDLLLVSAGFDIAASDPLGGMEVTPEGLVRIAAHLVNAAELLCKGRMVMVLEGGYSAFGLEEGVSACFEAMSGRVTVDDPRGPMVSLPLGDAAQYLDIYREFFPL